MARECTHAHCTCYKGRNPFRKCSSDRYDIRILLLPSNQGILPYYTVHKCTLLPTWPCDLSSCTLVSFPLCRRDDRSNAWHIPHDGILNIEVCLSAVQSMEWFDKHKSHGATSSTLLSLSLFHAPRCIYVCY
jgi:hypothetical protein